MMIWWRGLSTCSLTVSYFVSHFSSYLVEHCSSNSVRHSFSYLPSGIHQFLLFPKGFHFFTPAPKVFSSSINIAVVLSDLLGFTLVFVDSLAFGICDCFTLLLVRLQREFQMATIWPEYANNSLSSWTASAKSWLTCEQTSSSTVLHESWNGNF